MVIFDVDASFDFDSTTYVLYTLQYYLYLLSGAPVHTKSPVLLSNGASNHQHEADDSSNIKLTFIFASRPKSCLS